MADFTIAPEPVRDADQSAPSLFTLTTAPVTTASPARSVPDFTSVISPSESPATRSRGAIVRPCITQTRDGCAPSAACLSGGYLAAISFGGMKAKAALGTTSTLEARATMITAVEL